MKRSNNYINVAQQALTEEVVPRSRQVAPAQEDRRDVPLGDVPVAPAPTDVYDRVLPDLVLTPPVGAQRVAPPDYPDHVFDPMGGTIPADEPVFVLRGSDLSAPLVLGQWIEANKGSAPHLIAAARDMVRRMQAWTERRAAGWKAVPADETAS